MEPTDGGSSVEPRNALRFQGRRTAAKDKLAKARARNARAAITLAAPPRVVELEDAVLVDADSLLESNRMDADGTQLASDDESCASYADIAHSSDSVVGAAVGSSSVADSWMNSADLEPECSQSFEDLTPPSPDQTTPAMEGPAVDADAQPLR